MQDDPKEPEAPLSEGTPTPGEQSPGVTPPARSQSADQETPPDFNAFGETLYGDEPYLKDHGEKDPYHSDPYSPDPLPDSEPLTTIDTSEKPTATQSEVTPEIVPAPQVPAPPPPTIPPAKSQDSGGGDEEEDDGDDEGMLRMSFMEHLEELRTRILRALYGAAIAFVVALSFTNRLWQFVSAPAIEALRHLGFNDKLVQITPMETFSVVWVKMPMLVSLFLASPWVLYQVWAFIAPGLYKRERRYAVPFILTTAGLFISGGVFAYFVAFRYGLEFLLGIGRDINIAPMVSITEYFDLFVNVILGVACVFELPVVIFFLTLLRIASPSFLLRNSRYAILAIVVLAAIVTPTPDVFNLMLFALPMSLLFFLGVFASYLLVLKRENRKFPWKVTILLLVGILAVVAAVIWLLISHYHFHPVPRWPFLVR